MGGEEVGVCEPLWEDELELPPMEMADEPGEV